MVWFDFFGPRFQKYEQKNTVKKPKQRCLLWHGAERPRSKEEAATPKAKHGLQFGEMKQIKIFDQNRIWKKKGKALAKSYPSFEVRRRQHPIIWMFCYRSDWCFTQTRWEHKERTIYGNIQHPVKHGDNSVTLWASFIYLELKVLVNL